MKIWNSEKRTVHCGAIGSVAVGGSILASPLIDMMRSEEASYDEQENEQLRADGETIQVPVTDSFQGVLTRNSGFAWNQRKTIEIYIPSEHTSLIVTYPQEQKRTTSLYGNVHLCVVRGDRDDATWERELDENLTLLYNKAYELGGLASGEHGIGLSKQKYLVKASNPTNIALMKRVKQAFDDRKILNAGMSYDV